MPSDEVVLIRVAFLGDGVIHDEDTVLVFHLAHERLDFTPERGRSLPLGVEETGHAVVADGPVSQTGEVGGAGLTKGTQQKVGVEIEHLFVHRSSLASTTFSA